MAHLDVRHAMDVNQVMTKVSQVYRCLEQICTVSPRADQLKSRRQRCPGHRLGTGILLRTYNEGAISRLVLLNHSWSC